MFKEYKLPTVEIIKKNGYNFEIHYVYTEDDYILELHRIPFSKSGQKPTRNHPLFFHHGCLGDSSSWVISGAKTSLAMQLADEGYDVWLANCRGNTYSRKHKTMTYTESSFWNFSLNEIGKYDLPAAIDYILTNTKSPQIHYIGYSMGTTVFYVMGSERPEYHSKIRSQVSFAPVAYLSNSTSPIKNTAPYAHMMNIGCQLITKGMIFHESWMDKIFKSVGSHKQDIMKKLMVENLYLSSMIGSDPKSFNFDLIPVILGHFPAVTSSKLIEHYAQHMMKDNFAQYDYCSVEKNMEHYNSAEPPLYDLRSIQVPITLIYGKADILANTTDVMKLRDQLPKLIDAFPSNNPYCNHFDFLYGSTVNEDINKPVKKILMTTDDMNWVYTGPKPTPINNNSLIVKEWLPPQTLISNTLGLDYLKNNLEAIIAKTMPQLVQEEDKVMFEQEYNNTIILYRKIFEIIKSCKIENDQNDPIITYENLNKILDIVARLQPEQVPLKNTN